MGARPLRGAVLRRNEIAGWTVTNPKPYPRRRGSVNGVWPPCCSRMCCGILSNRSCRCVAPHPRGVTLAGVRAHLLASAAKDADDGLSMCPFLLCRRWVAAFREQSRPHRRSVGLPGARLGIGKHCGVTQDLRGEPNVSQSEAISSIDATGPRRLRRCLAASHS
jgi:hypothetical protein